MRSMLFVPAIAPSRFAKASASGRMRDPRSRGRGHAGATAAGHGSKSPVARDRRARRAGLVRINPVATTMRSTTWRVIDARPDGIVLPKARDGADVHRVDHCIGALSALWLPRGSIGCCR